MGERFVLTRFCAIRHATLVLRLAVCLLSSAFSVRGQGAKIITFDVPESVCEVGFAQCTVVNAINLEGTVVGTYADENGAPHGYSRTFDGAFTKFDVSGAVCPFSFSSCTVPTGINVLGQITGYYCDAVTCHGFVRAGNGAITTFDPEGSVFMGPLLAINDEGTIVGNYTDASFAVHGFVRSRDGTIATFDAPGAIEGTIPTAINFEGVIAGNYLDANFVSHGFVRSQNGSIRTFDPAGSTSTQVNGINLEGTIVGFYEDASFEQHGFLRSRNGAITTFDYPGAHGTTIGGINLEGEVFGTEETDAFVRSTSGALTPFSPPNSLGVPFPSGINDFGLVAGYYIDTSFLEHGFLRIPQYSPR